MRTHALRSRSRQLAVVLAAVTTASLAPAAAQAAPAATAAPSDVVLNLSVTETPGATPRTATLRCRGSRAVAGGYLSGCPQRRAGRPGPSSGSCSARRIPIASAPSSSEVRRPPG